MTVELASITADLLPHLHATVPADLVFWDLPQLYAWLDDAQKRLAKEGVFVIRATVTISAGVSSYNAPARHLSTLHVAHNNVPLKPATTAELENRDSAYLTTPGTPEYWYPDKGGFNKIGLYPVPNAAAITLSSLIEVVYHSYPAPLEGIEVITLGMPRAVADALSVEVIAEAYGKEGDSQVPEIAQHLKQLSGLEMEAIKSLWGGR